ncbi:MAG: hypothetical protein SPJ42_06625 [Oscillospiraceae bacterium]|nr:hypothetical protein [Oscillospiraceae bacterium]
MKTTKKVVSLLICAVMVATTILGAGLASLLKADAADEITIGGITQKRVVNNYETTYAEYQARFFTGANSNKPTNFVIPGLAEKDNYTPQGMTYWAAKEWILISAYDASGSGRNSVIYALDAKTTEFVALFKLINEDDTANTAHGGGIAVSEYNFYYADSASYVSYIPLSEFDVPAGTAKDVKIRGKIDLSGELNGVATSYVCYSDGVLWTGNFYWSGDDNYKKTWTGTYPSVLMGYKLKGNSSEEEWANLQNTNLIVPSEKTNATNGVLTYSVDGNEHGYIDLTNTTSADGSSELTYNFGTVNLKHGTKYVLEFDQNGDFASNDIYFLRDGGTGSFSNTKYAYNGGAMTKTSNGDGTYHYRLEFTPGTAIVGNAEGNWGNGSDASGSYTVRFDNDTYSAGATTKITNLKVYEANAVSNITKRDGYDRAGNPSYVVPFNNDLDRLQYAMVYDGKIYLSRSWSRSESDNHIRELCIGEFDINVPGATALSVNGRNRGCTVVAETDVTKFGGDKNNSKKTEMFYMSEALCIMDDYLYMFAESAAWNYNGSNPSNKCPEPIDVIWKIDQKEIMGETRHADTTVTEKYQKVKSLSEITDGEEYLIVHKSSQVDPSTGKEIIYAVDSYGGYDGRKLPKQDAGTRANTGDSMGVVGYPISDYTLDGDNLYISEEADKQESIHWAINGAGSGKMRIINKDGYFSKNMYLYFGSRLFAMTTSARTNLDRITLEKYDEDGNFRLYYSGNSNYYLWCNDGSNQSVINTYTNYYQNHGITAYSPNYNELYEQVGTFHADAEYLHTDTGNLLGRSVGTDMQMIQIYKRITNPYSSTEYSQIYTDINAELQADGTYTVNYETYSVNNSQYKRAEAKPTDYILMLDASNSIGSTGNHDVACYRRWGESNSLSLKNAAGTSKAGDRKTATYTGGNIYYQHSDGEYCKFNVDTVDAGGNIGNKGVYVWLYYTHSSGTTYWYNPNTKSFQTTRPANSATIKVNGFDDNARAGKTIYTGVHYSLVGPSYFTSTDAGRVFTMRNIADALTYKIAADSQATGLAHRIAVCQYGSGSTETDYNCTGIYTNSSTSMVPYSGSISTSNYANAFYSVGNFGTVRSIINNLPTSTNNNYTYASCGFEMANEIIKNHSGGYYESGDRNVCVIYITDAALGKDITAALSMANNAIAKAHETKGLGACIYTVQLNNNNSINGFTEESYTNAASSNYLSALSIGDTGARNDINNTDYVSIVPPAANSYDPNAIAQSVVNASALDRENAPVKLDTNSIIKQTLTDVFNIPENPTITVKYAQSQVDGLDRIYFSDPVAAPSSVTATYDDASRTITTVGYDYSTNYVSTARSGNKLIVSISGVTFDPSAEDNSISDYDKTAVYENDDAAKNNTAFKHFPNDTVSVKEYTYVLDYALPMREVVNGTPLSVDSLPQKQNTSSYQTEYNTKYSGVDIENNSLLYQLNAGSDGNELTSKGYVLIQRDNGKYEWVRVNIIPASNVLYEESNLTNLKDLTIADPDSATVSWVKDGTTADSYQSVTSDTDVYGYDPAYNNNNIYSNGSALTATVSSDSNKSKTATFEFTGTGFDLISACGTNTGVQVVTVRKGSSIEKIFIVDTYYNDGNYGTLYQVPIVSFSGTHDTYTVETTAAYLSFAQGIKHGTVETASIDGTDIEASSAEISKPTARELLAQIGMEDLADENVELVWMDDNSIFNGGTGAQGSTLSTQAGDPDISLVSYIDGYRVYNPLTTQEQAAYLPSEANAKYYNIINALNDSESGITGETNWLAYVEGGGDGKFTFADYKSNGGPSNEIYLDPRDNNGLTFKVKVNNADAKVMLSARAASGAPIININGHTDTLISATEMYYDITDIVMDKTSSAYEVQSDGSILVTVTIKNNGGGLLAINNIKLVNSEATTLTSQALPQVTALMNTAPVPVDLEALNETQYSSYKYAEFVASPDPGIDPDGETENEIPEVPEYNDVINAIVSIFEKIAMFFKNIFVNIKGYFNLF